MPNFSFRLLACLPFLVTACGGGGDSNDTPTQPTVPAAAITISTGSTGDFVSLTETRTATAVVRDANQAVIGNAPVSWATSNAAVATVTGTGSTATVTSVGNGSAIITATSGSVNATLPVVVAQKFSSLALTSPLTTLGIGATGQLSTVARDARSAPIAGVSGATFATSDRTRVVTDVSGAFIAIAPGSATLTATLTRDGVTASANVTLTVTTPSALPSTASVAATSGNAFTPGTVNIGVGGTVSWTFATDHNVLFSNAGAPSDIPTTNSGSISRAFNTIGTFNYTCSLHAGMNGVVIVGIPGLYAFMTGAKERPTPNASTANGSAVFTRSGTSIGYTVAYQGAASVPTGLHIHAPATTETTAGIVVDLAATPLSGVTGVKSGNISASDIRSIGGQPPISLDSLFTLLQNGSAYVNLHSTAFPAGEIRGQIGPP